MERISASVVKHPAAEIAPAGWGSVDVLSLLRPLLFALTFLLAWVGVEPFTDLSNPALLGTTEAGNPFNQFAYLGIAGLLFAIAASLDPRIFRVYWRPLLILSLAWIACSVLASGDPSLAARRFLYAALVIAMAGIVLILPRSLREFADLLAGLTLVILLLCFAGIMLAPGVTIHQATDVIEPALAGDWRGLFAHKNIAAAMMVVFVFLGLYVARIRSRLLGWLIVVLAAIFLVFTHGKTSSMLLPAILGLAWLLTRLNSNVARAAILLGGLALLNLATVGSAYSVAVRNVVGLVLPDVTYTGRTEIWTFAIDHVRERPLFGYGLGAFWGSSGVVNSAETEAEEGPNEASHAHNGYLDLALAAGVPGLLLAALWVLMAPLSDLKRIAAADADLPLMLLFVRIWLFGVYLSCFESVLFDRGNPIWFSMLIAMFGLRLMTMCRFAP